MKITHTVPDHNAVDQIVEAVKKLTGGERLTVSELPFATSPRALHTLLAARLPNVVFTVVLAEGTTSKSYGIIRNG